MSGRIADTVLPPALTLRLRAFMRRGDSVGHLAPPRLLSSLVPPGRVAIDVGAHRGLWTFRMSARASAVHAFEPNPDLFAYLSRARLRSVTTHDVALSDSDGTAVLSMPEGMGTGLATIATAAGHNIATVETRRLDSFEFTDVGFLKVDVEGHEEAVLRGSTSTLQESRPTLCVEIEERHNPGALDRIPAALAELGYAHSYYLFRGQLNPMETFNVERHQLEVPSATSPDYVNNFVFACSPLAS
jgi:FkbM family methyltransferase